MTLNFLEVKNEQFIPSYQIYDCEVHDHHDLPDRITEIAIGLELGGAERLPTKYSTEKIDLTTVHHPSYIKFLSKQGKTQVIPYVFGNSSKNHVLDTLTPLSSSAFDAAKKNVSAIVSSLDYLVHYDRLYFLLRPPGHHASKNSAAGYCYLNNISFAAKELIKNERKVAILDFDFDHGNGTQDIFYDQETLFVSLHVDPSNEFPYYSGFKDEIGSGKGLGRNINFPLPRDTDESSFGKILDLGIEKIIDDNPDIVLISLGYDIARKDDGFNIDDEYFYTVGTALNNINKPLVIFQEGGYNHNLLTNAAKSFAQAFKN